MYCSKRFSYRYAGYVTRTLLAAIDHNKHLNRKPAKTQAGETIKGKAFNKRTKRFVPVDILEPKKYAYIDELLVSVFMERVVRPGSMDEVLPMATDDPRRIFENRFMTPAPPMAQLLEEHVSRFAK